MSIVFVKYRFPCSYCKRAGNACCFYDSRMTTKSCARCVRSHRCCPYKVEAPRVAASAAVNKLEGAARASGAAPAWVDGVSKEYYNNRT